MSVNRREFLEKSARGVAAIGAITLVDSASYGDTKTSPADPDSNDPNAIVDPDHEIGKPYVGWKEGELDLHFIHTGRTENCFHIYPDGTTMLLDTGERSSKNFSKTSWNPYGTDSAACAAKPDESRHCGEWVARYIERLRPDLKKIDYVMASHFHGDHIGQANEGAGKKGLEGDKDYQISGIAEVGEYYDFGTAFDRGYPDYSRPTKWAPGERKNLVKFWDYAESQHGMKREKFEVGALDQIKLVNAPEKYDFCVRNICANGVCWGGEGAENVDYFERYPENKTKNQNENTRSIAIVMQYGGFRFYTGGDVAGTLYDDDGKDVDYEGQVGRVVGPVDVCKTNHHASSDAMRASFVKAVQSRVYVTCCWWRGHVNDKTSKIMCDQQLYSGPRLLCPTDPHPENAEMFQGKPWRQYMCEMGGHVVVKVVDGGARYKVYFLTADDESMRVSLVFGPFESTGTRRLEEQRTSLS
ncbi:MAG: MBL fold metallo-hydrolase [Thermoguttaceae bacterium]|jgi:beta-lactamase superfamily II metal-dependent hydrolase